MAQKALSEVRGMAEKALNKERIRYPQRNPKISVVCDFRQGTQILLMTQINAETIVYCSVLSRNNEKKSCVPPDHIYEIHESA